MKLIRSARELDARGRKVSFAIGFFDGVHLGHQQVIAQTIADARQVDGLSLVVTFDRHPAEVVAPGKQPPLIYTTEQRVEAIRALGVDALLLLPFDEALSRLSGETFIRQLIADLGDIESICVGSNFVFGHQRSGNVELLQRMGTELHFKVHGLSAVASGDAAVSSTRIRETIRQGDLAHVSALLGREYVLAGVIISGDQVGRKLGFPTANIAVQGRIVPAYGVYAARVKVKGQVYPAALNIGLRPTLRLPAPQLHVEAHLLGFSGDIYGEQAEVTFVSKLRDERKFASLEELKTQIALDVQSVREQLGAR